MDGDHYSQVNGKAETENGDVDCTVKKKIVEEVVYLNGHDKDIEENQETDHNEDQNTKEKFLVEVSGLKKFDNQLFNKLVTSELQLKPNWIKTDAFGPRMLYMNFNDEEARAKAILLINGYKWQKVTLKAVKADALKDPTIMSKISFTKVAARHNHLPLGERIETTVAPMFNVAYDFQIKEKTNNLNTVLRKISNRLATNNPFLKDFVYWHKARRKGQVCEVDVFVKSPIKLGYRNKCEFVIGKADDSEKTVVGFRIGNSKKSKLEIGNVSHMKHLDQKIKSLVKFMETYLETSKYEPFEPITQTGFWRQLTVRTTNNDDVMMVVMIHPQELSDDEIDQMKDDLKNYFTIGEGFEAGVTSLYFQRSSLLRKSIEADYEHLYGKTYIEETICGKNYKVSPSAYLKENTAACELLYEKVLELAELDEDTVVLDLCSGAGGLALTLAENASKVIGVESNPCAVGNARYNAEHNGASNVTFLSGKAEDHIETMLEEHAEDATRCIAIVDPPLSGIDQSVMKALRKCDHLDKIIYISSSLHQDAANFMVLGNPRNSTHKGNYFVPIRATAVDMFPNMYRYEVIIIFERYDEEKWDAIMSGKPKPEDKEYYDRIPQKTANDQLTKKNQTRKPLIKRRQGNVRSRLQYPSYRGSYPSSRGYYGNYGGRGYRGVGSYGNDYYSWGRGRGYRYGSEDYVGRPGLIGPNPYYSFEGPSRNFATGYQQGYLAALEIVSNRNPRYNNQYGYGGGWK